MMRPEERVEGLHDAPKALERELASGLDLRQLPDSGVDLASTRI
jgi:hypothetical protein